jgi:hypothetical protein
MSGVLNEQAGANDLRHPGLRESLLGPRVGLTDGVLRHCLAPCRRTKRQDNEPDHPARPLGVCRAVPGLTAVPVARHL